MQITSLTADTLCRNEYIYHVTVRETHKPVLQFFNHFFQFQLNTHNMLNLTFITNYLLHVSVFVTPSSGRALLYLLKTVCFLSKLHNGLPQDM
jgi:hypothetical protein